MSNPLEKKHLISTEKDKTLIAEVIDEVIFRPSSEQRRTKAAFWVRHAENPLVSADKITLSFAQQITRDSRLKNWWKSSGFLEWFTNQDEFRQRVEYLAHLALDAIEDILLDPEGNQNAKVNTAKLIIEASNKMPPRVKVEKVLDERINKMGRDQLDAYLRKNLHLLKKTDR
ncbi:hypothetical protein PN36_34995 [Candidatus Thiomargarita nelsonii]|uniref:Uncharacterized protein n=1 Tax=Candidatus Thiomargarita nelsonii TaxID=1003181 RepID=A0A4E0QIZ5_9GAMM|nr:hypothetical protein PN36_34995 [Candidatus Thiomargarita nelsonii]